MDTINSKEKIKHWPGPWTIADEPFDGEDNITIEKDGCPLCEVRGTNDMSCIDEEDIEKINGEVMANAKLIAAAPELLEAAKELLDACMKADAKEELGDDVDGGIMDKMMFAIRKATDDHDYHPSDENAY